MINLQVLDGEDKKVVERFNEFELSLYQEAGKVMSELEKKTYTPSWKLREKAISKDITRISLEHIAKLSPTWMLLEGYDEFGQRLGLMKLVNEYSLLERAYEAGLRVPKPEGIFGIPIKKDLINPFAKEILVPGLVMQYIPGSTLDKVEGSSYSIAVESFNQEIEKAKKLGFKPGDHRDLRNAIWHPKEGITYVIDLALWENENS